MINSLKIYFFYPSYLINCVLDEGNTDTQGTVDHRPNVKCVRYKII